MVEAAVIVMQVRPEMVAGELGCEKVVITHQEMQDVSGEELLIPKLPEDETELNRQGPSGSQPNNDKVPEGDDDEEEPMDHDLSFVVEKR